MQSDVHATLPFDISDVIAHISHLIASPKQPSFVLVADNDWSCLHATPLILLLL